MMKARAACEAKAAQIGFAWEPPAIEIEAEDGCAEASEAPIAVSVPA